MKKVEQHEACRREWSDLFAISKSVSQVVKVIQNNSALERRVTQTSADYSSAGRRRGKNKFFKVLHMAA